MAHSLIEFSRCRREQQQQVAWQHCGRGVAGPGGRRRAGRDANKANGARQFRPLVGAAGKVHVQRLWSTHLHQLSWEHIATLVGAASMQNFPAR